MNLLQVFVALVSSALLLLFEEVVELEEEQIATELFFHWRVFHLLSPRINFPSYSIQVVLSPHCLAVAD